MEIIGDKQLKIQADKLTNIRTPQQKIMSERKNGGPIFRIRTVAGGWKTTYVTKNIRTTSDLTNVISNGLENCKIQQLCLSSHSEVRQSRGP